MFRLALSIYIFLLRDTVLTRTLGSLFPETRHVARVIRVTTTEHKVRNLIRWTDLSALAFLRTSLNLLHHASYKTQPGLNSRRQLQPHLIGSFVKSTFLLSQISPCSLLYFWLCNLGYVWSFHYFVRHDLTSSGNKTSNSQRLIKCVRFVSFVVQSFESTVNPLLTKVYTF